MIAFTDSQIRTLTDVASRLPTPEKQRLFFQRVTAMLTQRRGRSRPAADYEVAECTALALAGLGHKPVA